MEKYGADVNQPDGEKTASNKQKCPICGKESDSDSETPHCPDHGTKPFERRTEDQ